MIETLNTVFCKCILKIYGITYFTQLQHVRNVMLVCTITISSSKIHDEMKEQFLLTLHER